MIPYLAKSTWGRLLLIPVIITACGWSWFTYVLGKVPADKRSYWADNWGFTSPEMEVHWAYLQGAPGVTEYNEGTYHELKNIGAEWCRAWPQTAAKVLSMFIGILVTLWLITVLLVAVF